jgi:hypothetical protein
MENPASRRNTISKVITHNRGVILVELLLAGGLVGLHASGVVSSAVIYLFILGSISLWLRKSSWWRLGLKRPTDWGATIGYATIAGLGYQAISLFLIVPVLQRLTNQPLDLSQFESLKGDPAMLITWLLTAWVIAAFGEELVYPRVFAKSLGRCAGKYTSEVVDCYPGQFSLVRTRALLPGYHRYNRNFPVRCFIGRALFMGPAQPVVGDHRPWGIRHPGVYADLFGIVSVIKGPQGL